MQLAEALEPEQQAAELILPAEHALNGAKSLLEDLNVEKSLATAFSTTLAPWMRVAKSVGGSGDNDKEPQAERTAWR